MKNTNILESLDREHKVNQSNYIAEPIQSQIVGALLTTQTKNIILNLDYNILDNPHTRQILGITKELIQKYNTFPSIEVVRNELLKHQQIAIDKELANETLDECLRYDQTQTQYYIDLVSELVKQKVMIKAVNTAHKAIGRGNFDNTKIKVIFDDMVEKVEKIEQPKSTLPSSIFDDLELFIEEKDEQIPTSIRELDEQLNGGLPKKGITLICGGTGIGKTTISTILAQNFATSGYKTLQVFFEETKPQMMVKHFSRLLGKTQNEISKNRNEIKGILQGMREDKRLLALHHNLRLLELKKSQVIMADFLNQTKQIINEGFNLDVLMIDYLSCFHTDNNSWEEELPILTELETFAKENNIVVILSEQLNRSGNKTKDDANSLNIQGTKKKIDCASVILSLFRTQEQKMNSKCDIKLEKSRVGASGFEWKNAHFDNSYLEIDLSVANQEEDDDIPFEDVPKKRGRKPKNKELLEIINNQ